MFDPITIPPFLKNFNEKQVQIYLSSGSIWSLNLVKVCGQGILYGLDHVSIRQSFFNNLDKEQRIELFFKKLNYFNLSKSFESIGISKKNVTNCLDIGMAHGLYKVYTEKQQFVIKKQGPPPPENYHKVLSLFHRKTLSPNFIKTPYGYWEYSNFLGKEYSVKCSKFLAENTLQKLAQQKAKKETKVNSVQDESIIKQLGRHAVIGDVFGLGDRHFENYIVHPNGEIISLDISYFFWPGNDVWIYRYLLGGMSEFSYLYLYKKQNNFIQLLHLFFESYAQSYYEICKELPKIQSLLGESSEKQHAYLYIQHNTKNHLFLQAQKKLYCIALKNMHKLQLYKKLLATLLKKKTIKNIHPLLKMYYLADKNRLSSFFLLDLYKRKHLLNILDTYTDSTFKKKLHWKTMNDYCDTL